MTRSNRPLQETLAELASTMAKAAIFLETVDRLSGQIAQLSTDINRLAGILKSTAPKEPSRFIQVSDTPAKANLIRLPEVRKRVGKATTTIYREMDAGTFPRPIPIGGARVAWLESDIDAWIAARIEAADTQSR